MRSLYKGKIFIFMLLVQLGILLNGANLVNYLCVNIRVCKLYFVQSQFQARINEGCGDG